jgi:hypothetical protein
MAGALPRYRSGPASYPVSGLVLGGQLVQPTTGTGTQVQVAAALTHGQPNILGVAGSDANTTNYPEGTPSLSVPGVNTSPNDNLNPILNSAALDYTVAVYNNVDIPVNYDGAVNFGAFLQSSATVAGAVGLWDASNPERIVGKCTQPGGVPAAGTYRAYIRV